jgi:hypothetical protein
MTESTRNTLNHTIDGLIYEATQTKDVRIIAIIDKQVLLLNELVKLDMRINDTISLEKNNTIPECYKEVTLKYDNGSSITILEKE